MVGDSLVLVTEGSECRTKKIVQASCCCLLAAVQHAVAADKGLSTLGRRSTSRGRAAFQNFAGRRAAPAVVLSTIT